MDTYRNVNGTWVKCGGLEDFRPLHYERIGKQYDRHIATGRVTVTVGEESWPMQIRDIDLNRMDGAIRYNELEGTPTMYVTDADNVNHQGVSIPDAKAVLLEMMRAAYQAHALKQQARNLIDSCSTVEEMEAVNFGDV